MSRRGIQVLGLGAAAGAGYYLYNAGGSPKAAEKHAQADLHKVSANLRGENVTDRTKEAEKRGQAYAAQAGKEFDKTVDEIKAKAAEAEKKGEEISKEAKAKFAQYSSETKKDVNSAIDNFDKTVEKKTQEAKSGLSSWFGFGGK